MSAILCVRCLSFDDTSQQEAFTQVQGTMLCAEHGVLELRALGPDRGTRRDLARPGDGG